MTDNPGTTYCPLLMDGWQSKAAFVIHCRPETDLAIGRFEGRVEHIASYKSTRFHSLDEFLAFVAMMLAEVRKTEEP